MTGQLECSSYRFADRDEYCLRSGVKHSIQILLVPPLFDEMNRMRRMIADIMRLLDNHDVGTTLPDLPGTNESLYPQQDTSLEIWREALNICRDNQQGCSHIVSFRGGCLIDDLSDNLPVWRLTPVKGNSLLRTMLRTRIASDKEAGTTTSMADLANIVKTESIELAGNIISPPMFAQLQDSVVKTPKLLRTARLESDSKSADVRLNGTPLWLRAEPDADPSLSQSIADDLVNWIRG